MHRHDQDEDQSKSCRQEVDKGAMREQGNVNRYGRMFISQYFPGGRLNHIVEFPCQCLIELTLKNKTYWAPAVGRRGERGLQHAAIITDICPR